MENFEITPLNKGITLRRILLFLAMTAAGLAGNYFNFLLFLNINFLFGSIFSMLALQCFGFAPGILAAAIISGYTYILWGHPYVIIIMTAEAAVVGWLMSRCKMKMVLADMLYWLIIGIPLVYLFFHVVMHSSLATAAVLANKLIVNGIANVLIARLIFTGFSLRSHSFRVPFSEIIYNMLAFFVLCPSLMMLAVGSRTDFAETDKYIRSILIQDSRNIEQYLKTWINKREIAVASLATMAASMSPQQIQPYLELIAKSDTDFLRIGLLSKDAITTAYYPLSDELGQQNIGKNFADRPFIPTLKQTLKPMPSEVVMGRVGIPKPMVTMLAPVVIDGAYGGYVSGILSLEQIRAYLDVILHYNGTLYTLIDRNRSVIMTNRTDQKVMARFERGNGTIHPLDAQMSQWEPFLPANTSATERSAKSLYVTEITLGDMATWKVILEQPVAPFQQRLYNTYTGKLSLLFLILIAALLLSEWLSYRLLAALEQLSIMTRDLPEKLLTDGRDTVWFESAITEVNHLIHNFRQMADTLTGQFQDLQQTQNALEQAYSDVEMQVRDRTSELNAVNTALLTEITERRRMEDVLRESEQRYRTILQTAMDGFWMADFEGRLLDVNESYCRMIGYSREELLEMNISDIEVKETPEIILLYMKKAMAQGENRFETRHRRKFGSILDIEVSVQYRPEAGGQVVAFLRDITDMKRQEEDIRLRSLVLDQIQDQVTITSLDGIIRYVNQAQIRKLGRPMEQILGKSTYIYGDDPKQGVTQLEIIEKTLSDGSWRGEVVNFTADGSEHIMDCRTQIIYDGQGIPAALCCVSTDITDNKRSEKALKESEERFHILVKNSSDIIVAINPDGTQRYVSQAVERITGYRPEEVIGKSFTEINHPDDREEVIRIWIEGIQNPEKAFKIRYRHIHKTKGWVYLEAVGQNFINDPIIQAGVVSVRDITERKQAEEALCEKQRLLEELNQSLEERIEKAVKELRQKDQVLIQQSRMAAMGEMIGNIAHQWRQPLNSLSLVIANIQDAYQFNELDAEYMDNATADCYRLIQKMSTTISDFFNFFRPNKKISVFSAHKQIQEAISLVQASFKHHNIVIHFETAHDVKLMGLPNEYSQVLLNLLSNARDAIQTHKNGGGRVDIRIENTGDTGCVMVRDNGGGIPEDILEKIFDPYFTTRPQGTGIGLYMSKMIIEGNMNGRITAHNVDGGAEFAVSVPLAASEAGSTAA